MRDKSIKTRLREDAVRGKLLAAFKQPLTTRQISKKIGLPLSLCGHRIALLADLGLLICLNPTAQNSRVYGLSETGQRYRQRCREEKPLPPYHQPDIDWTLYGWLCYRHRAAVLNALTAPLQPSQIKRLLRLNKPHLRISANNIRDIIKQFQAKGLIEPVRRPGKAHLQYQLTETGTKLRQVLNYAESPI